MKDDGFSEKRKVLLVDGHGLAFRAFYALPEMTAPDGTPTNAVLGFVNMLLRVAEECRPDGAGIFFDPKGPTERDAVFAAYKEGRRPTPDAFKRQLPIIMKITEALGFPVFVKEGSEADDLIASTARNASGEGMDVVILSADKDLFQLLGDGVTMLRPLGGVKQTKRYDVASFTEEYGFPPERMADYLALCGDAVDNIPGVPGIGDKTARLLLKEFGSLDGIYGSLDAMPEKRRALLSRGRDFAYLSHRLVLPTDVEAIATSLLELRGMDEEALVSICTRLGLKKLMERLGLAASFLSDGSRDVSGAEPGVVSTEDAPSKLERASLEALLREDLLVLSENPDVLLAPDGRWAPLSESDFDGLSSWTRQNRLVLADYRRWCERVGALRSHPANVWDVELAHYFLHPDAPGHSMERGLFGGELLAAEILAQWREYRRSEFVEDMDRIMREIDAPLTPALLDLQERGLHVDRDALERLDEALRTRLVEIEKRIFSAAGGEINLNSPKQLGELLFDKLHLPVIKRTKTGYSTDVSVLEELARLPEPLGEIPAMMLEYRECSKMSSGFVHPFLKYAAESADGRVHSTFLHSVTGTGRLASRDPNVQNLPVFGSWAEAFRGAIGTGDPSRVFVGADYSQIELRVLAHLSGEERLLDAFSKGLDIHLETASWVFGLDPGQITPEQRRFAKTVNFGLLYGMGAHGLALRMGIGRVRAAEMVERYFSVLPRVKSYLEESAREAKKRGYTRSVPGRIRPLAEVTTAQGRGGDSMGRVSVNTPIQSTAADIAKIALLRLGEELRRWGDKTFPVLQVHDSLICEVPEKSADEVESLLVRTMESVKCIDVPLRAEPKRGRSLAEV